MRSNAIQIQPLSLVILPTVRMIFLNLGDFDTYLIYMPIFLRYAETAIPDLLLHSMKISDRLLYGTDMGYDLEMYRITLES